MHRKMNRAGCAHRHGPRDSERDVADDQGLRHAHGQTRTCTDGSAMPHSNQVVRNLDTTQRHGSSSLPSFTTAQVPSAESAWAEPGQSMEDPESNANGRSDTRRRGGRAGGEGRPEERARLVESFVGGDPHRFDHVHHQPEGNFDFVCTSLSSTDFPRALTRIHTFEGILTASSSCIYECRDHAGPEHVSGQACGACGCCTRSSARKRGLSFPRAPCVTQRSTRTKGERGKRKARRRK